MHEPLFLFLCFFSLMYLFPFYLCRILSLFIYLYLFLLFILFPSYFIFIFYLSIIIFHFFSFNNLRFFSFYNTPIIYLIYMRDYSSQLVMRKIEAIKFACACMHACSLITGVVVCSLLFFYFFISFIFSSSWSIFYSKPAYTK